MSTSTAPAATVLLPLDRPMSITVFPDVQAKSKDVQFITLNEFTDQLLNARAPTKDALRLFSPASFGSKRTAAKSLRHDNNLIEIFAIVGDYDGGKTGIAEAVTALGKANICGIVVATPSHTPEFPKWRIVCPLSDPLNRQRANATGFELAEHHKLISRLAGALPDGLAAESWNKSQSWFAGTIDSAPDHQVHRVVEGLCIDQLSYLDQTAVPRPGKPTKLRASRGTSRRKAEPILIGNVAGLAPETVVPDDALPLDIQAALGAIAQGEGSHDALVALCGKLAVQGVPETTAVAMLQYAADQRPRDRQDDGWRKMRASIARTVSWAVEKEAAATSATLLLAAAPAAGPGGSGAIPPGPPPPPPPQGPPGGGSRGPAPQPPPPPGSGTSTAQAPHTDLGANTPEPYSDEWLALQFAEQHQGWWRYVEELGFWRLWDDVVWRKDDTQRLLSRVRFLNRHASLVTGAKRGQRMKLNHARTAIQVAKLVQADRRLALSEKEWDRQLMWLNTPGYVVRLTNQAQQPHCATDYITKVTKVTPDPGAACPLWKAFLLRIMGGDQDLVDYLQRVCGYMLTGHTLEQALFFGYGTGANGKSTFTGVLLGILGLVPTGYVAVAPTSTFVASRHEQHSTDLAMMAGARCVIATETEAGRSWPIAKIQAMSAGDPITARFMNKNNFTYLPQYKIFITGNHKPRLHGVDEAIRRRLHLIPFATTIPVSERDAHLPRKLRAEYPAILAWMIAGCTAWQQQGLNPPAAVLDTTREYLADEDLVGNWIDAHCTVDPGKAAYASELYGSFKAWLEQAGERVRPQRWLTQALADRGYAHRRGTDGQRAVLGLRLKLQSGMAPP